MREMLTVVKGNYRKNKGSYICITLLMFVVTLVMVTVLSVMLDTGSHDKKAIENAGLGNMIAALDYKSPDMTKEEYVKFSEDIASDIEDIEAVERVDLIDSLVMNIEDINGQTSGSSVFIFNYRDYKLHYKYYDEFGKNLDSITLNKGEIIVPISFQALYDCKIGDRVSLITIDTKNSMSYEVVAYVEDPYMGSSVMGIKTLFMSDEDIEYVRNSTGDATAYTNIVSVFSKPDSDMTDVELEATINKKTQLVSYCWITLTWTQAYNYMTIITNVFSAILVLFMIMLIIVTMIVLSHNINSSIENDYVNLGILKAVGMTTGKLRITLTAGYMLAAVIGVVLGIPVSIPVINALNILIRPATGLYLPCDIAFFESCVLLFVLLTVISLFVALKLRKLYYITPVAAIHGGKKDVQFSSLFKLPISKKFLDSSLAYRQLTSGKKQYISGIVITVILVFFMSCITDTCVFFSDEDNVEKMFSVIDYDITVSAVSDEIYDEIDSIIAPYASGERFVYVSRYMLVDDTQVWVGVCDAPERIQSVYKGRTCTYDNEVLITEYMTENYGIGIGDTVTVGTDGYSAEYIVSGYYQCSNDTGKNLTMSLAGFERMMGKESKENSYRYILKDDKKASEIIDKVSSLYSEDVAVVVNNGDFSGDDVILMALYGITGLIYVLSGIFVVITVVLVCSKIFSKEKQDYGIYKAFGYTSDKIRSQFAMRFMIAAFVGSVVGIILTILLSDSIVGLLLESFGIYNFSSRMNVISAVIPVLFMTMMYYCCSYIVSKRIKRVTPRVLITE